MRITSYASEQYRKNAPVERPTERVRTELQASVQTTTVGFSLGKFGVDYSSRKTVFDPSFAGDVRRKRQQAGAFRAQRDVEKLRARVGREGASYRDSESVASGDVSPPPAHLLKSALAAYTRNEAEIPPSPGSMLAAVV